MSATEPMTDAIIVYADLPDGDLDEIAHGLEEAGADATIGPIPARMGLLADAVTVVLETTVEALAKLLATVAGRRVWRALIEAVRRRRGAKSGPAAGEPVLVVHDERGRLRIDLTLADLADDRVFGDLELLRDIAKAAGPTVLRWDGTTGRLRASAETAGPLASYVDEGAGDSTSL
jgi:hypothetical protein